MKTVAVIGYDFDCLPGHVSVPGKGTGKRLQAAVGAGVRAVLNDKRLHRKHVHNFKLSVVVLPAKNGE